MQLVYAEYLLTAEEWEEFCMEYEAICLREDDALNLQIAAICEEQQEEVLA